MDNKRFFWDSKLAIWLEDKLNNLTNWFVDKRYPVTDWNESFYKEPTNMPPIVDTPVVDVIEVAAPKVKKARKKKAKKAA